MASNAIKPVFHCIDYSNSQHFNNTAAKQYSKDLKAEIERLIKMGNRELPLIIHGAEEAASRAKHLKLSDFTAKEGRGTIVSE